MLSILSFITGLAPALTSIWTSISDLQKTKIIAATDVEKAQIQAQINELHDKAQVLIAEAGSRFNSYVRLGLAIGPAAYITKIFLWDKVIGSFVGCNASESVYCTSFTTDALKDPNLWWIALTVVGFYFVTSSRWTNK